MRTDTGKIIRLEDYKQTDYSIGTVHLAFKLDTENTVVTAMSTFHRREDTPAGSPLALDGDGLV